MKTGFLLLLLCILAGCASPKEKGVKIGMSMSEVKDLIGPPTRKNIFSCPKYARNCPAIWQYDGYNVSFSDGIVDATQ